MHSGMATPVTQFFLWGTHPKVPQVFFKISSKRPASGFVKATPPALGLTENSNGSANFDPATAYSDLGTPGIQKPLWITYNVDPFTTGSTNQKCIGTTPAQNIFVNPLPPIALVNPSPADLTVFCYNSNSVSLLSYPAAASITWSGSGIVDNTNGSATFNPQQGFDNYVFVTGGNTTLNQTMPIAATNTDTYGCQNTVTRHYTVKPLSPAVFTYPSTGRT